MSTQVKLVLHKTTKDTAYVLKFSSIDEAKAFAQKIIDNAKQGLKEVTL